MPTSIGKFISSRRKECVKRKLVFDVDVDKADKKIKVSDSSQCDDI
jgi:DNA primase catalytic subunit